MAKPIFIVKLPSGVAMESYIEMQTALDEKMPDYYSLLMFDGGDKITYEVFYEKDFNEVKYEELKQIVKDSCHLVNP